LALHLLALIVERQDILNQISLRVVCTCNQFLGACSDFLSGFLVTGIHAAAHGCRVVRHGYWSLAHEVGTLSAEAHRHAFRLRVRVLLSSLVVGHFLRSILFLLAVEQLLLLLLDLLHLLGVRVHLLGGCLLNLLLLLLLLSRLEFLFVVVVKEVGHFICLLLCWKGRFDLI